MNNICIPEKEFSERIKKTQTLIIKNKLDAILAFGTECEPMYTRYFADYWPNFETAGVFIPAKGNPILLIGPESQTYAAAHSKLKNMFRLSDFRESSQPDYPNVKLPTWKDIFRQFPSKRLGLVGWHLLPHTIFQNIQQYIGKGTITNADTIVRSLMIKKSKAEIACLRKSAKLSEIGMKAALNSIKPGMTEVHLVGIATQAMLAAGAESTGYAMWCSSGSNTTQAICRPTLKKIKKGEVVQLQIGAKYAGYSTSIGRPVALGKCNKEKIRFVDIGLQAEKMVVKQLCNGVNAGDVAKSVHGYIKEQGYGHTILYGPAHGCGQMECEYPFIETSSNFLLESGMTFHADVFLANSTMGFRWEDCVVIGEKTGMALSELAQEVIFI